MAELFKFMLTHIKKGTRIHANTMKYKDKANRLKKMVASFSILSN